MDIDTKLLKGRASDAEIVDHLLSQHYSQIRRFALGVVGDEDSADDVAQQTVLQAVKKIEQYRPQTNMRAWLLRIAMNEARQLLRKRKSRERVFGLWRRNEPVVSPKPETLTIEKERDEKIWRCVSQLEEKHRLPILLRYTEELSTQEIAHVLGIPHGTVRSRLHYAHKQLQGLLKSEVIR